MPAHNFIQAGFQRLQVQETFKLQRERNVVIRLSGFKLIEKPQALLRKRKRRGLMRGTPGDEARFLPARCLVTQLFHQQSALGRRQNLQPIFTGKCRHEVALYQRRTSSSASFSSMVSASSIRESPLISMSAESIRAAIPATVGSLKMSSN